MDDAPRWEWTQDPEMRAALEALRAWLGKHGRSDPAGPAVSMGTYSRIVHDIDQARRFSPEASGEAQSDAECRAFEEARMPAARAARVLSAYFRQHDRAQALWADLTEEVAPDAKCALPDAQDVATLLAALAARIDTFESRREARRAANAVSGYFRHWRGCVVFKSDRAGLRPWSTRSLLLFSIVFRLRSHLAGIDSGVYATMGPMPDTSGVPTPWTLVAALLNAALPADGEAIDGRLAKKRFEALTASNPDAEFAGW